MDYTTGKWMAEAYTNGTIWVRLTQAYAIAEICTAKEGDGHLIAAAVNGCQAVNPANPMAAAETIKEVYESLKLILLEVPIRNRALAQRAANALDKAEGRPPQ